MEATVNCRPHVLTLSVLLVAVISAPAIGAQDFPSVRLIPTDREAARIRVLQDSLENHRTDDVKGSYAELKTIVQDFVIRQVQSAPAISDDALRDQLRRVIGHTWAEHPDGGLFVRSDGGWGPRSKQRVWVVAYAVFLGSYTPDGIGVVIDSYLWEPTGARLAGRQDEDFSGYSLDVDWLAGGPDHVIFLAYGRTAGSNGLGTWKAAVYSGGAKGVTTVWQSPLLHGLTAVGRDEVIAFRYGRPCEGAASSACAWTYDVYALDDWTRHLGITLVSRQVREQ